MTADANLLAVLNTVQTLVLAWIAVRQHQTTGAVKETRDAVERNGKESK